MAETPVCCLKLFIKYEQPENISHASLPPAKSSKNGREIKIKAVVGSYVFNSRYTKMIF